MTMRDLRNIVVTLRDCSGCVQAWPGGYIQPWYHMRANQEVYGTTWAASTGYM
jgi:hypothetical protein